jgi:hypothetical protein
MLFIEAVMLGLVIMPSLGIRVCRGVVAYTMVPVMQAEIARAMVIRVVLLAISFAYEIVKVHV